MTLFVPSIYALPTGHGASASLESRDEHRGLLSMLAVAPRQEYTDREWHVFVDVVDVVAERTLHIIIGRRRYGQRLPWTIQRQTTCAVARDGIQQLGREYCWGDVPAAVRHLVMQDLGLTQ